MRDILTNGHDLNEFGRMLHMAWQVKKSVEESISTSVIDDWYERGRNAGALGGKLLGAGSGGFLLFFCEPHLQPKLCAALPELVRVPFGLEPEGSKVIFVGGDL